MFNRLLDASSVPMSELGRGLHVFILLATESFSVGRFGLGKDGLDPAHSKINEYLGASFFSQSLLEIPGMLPPKSSFIICEQAAPRTGGTWGACWCLTLC